jgi:hypothetical protein
VKQFIANNPDHKRASDQILEYLRDEYCLKPYEIPALVYLNDDPRQTSEKIFELLSTRGLRSADEIRGILETGGELAAPLADGAL